MTGESPVASDNKKRGVVEGFEISEETLALLDPIEKIVAVTLIERGTWKRKNRPSP